MSIGAKGRAGCRRIAEGDGTGRGRCKKWAVKREYRDHRLEWMIRSRGLDVVLEGIKDNNIRFSNELS